jgi:signal transduction histidine kinase
VRIRQILGNLVSNAVKYTDRGGITVRVAVREGGKAPGPGRWIAVDVSDTGPGIPEERQKLLFRELSPLERGARPGAGIGLAISQRIARALGGQITVESAVGKGSTFTLWLPVETGRAGSGRSPT